MGAGTRAVGLAVAQAVGPCHGSVGQTHKHISCSARGSGIVTRAGCAGNGAREAGNPGHKGCVVVPA